jgi:hypothetical protein
MTGDEFKAKALTIVSKYDRGIFNMEDVGDALWQLAQAAADEENQRVSVSSLDESEGNPL